MKQIWTKVEKVVQEEIKQGELRQPTPKVFICMAQNGVFDYQNTQEDSNRRTMTLHCVEDREQLQEEKSQDGNICNIRVHEPNVREATAREDRDFVAQQQRLQTQNS